MNEISITSMGVYLLGVFLSSVSQVLLKKGAMKEHKNIIREYLNVYVIFGYGLFFLCVFLNTIAYRGIPMSLGPVLETTGYIYVTIFGVVIFHEKMNKKKFGALCLILLGIIVYVV